MIVIFILLFILWIIVAHSDAEQAKKEMREKIERETAPCRHGVEGAKFEIARCRLCAKEERERLEARRKEFDRLHEERRAELEKDRLREEARLQRVHDLKRVQELINAENERIENVKESMSAQELFELSGIFFLRSLHPEDFEIFVSEMYKAKGWESETTQLTGDYGIDIFLRSGNELVLVQCKRNDARNRVGRPVLQALMGNVADYQSRENNKFNVRGLVVTTSSLTREAVSWTEGKPLGYIDEKNLIKILKEIIFSDNKDFRHYLVNLLQRYKVSSKLLARNIESNLPSNLCPKCSDLIEYNRCINPNCNYYKPTGSTSAFIRSTQTRRKGYYGYRRRRY